MWRRPDFGCGVGFDPSLTLLGRTRESFVLLAVLCLAHLDFLPVFPFFTLFNKAEKVHGYNAGKGVDELPIHHGVSV